MIDSSCLHMPIVREPCSIIHRSRLISDYAIARLDPIYNAMSFVYRLHIIVRRYTLAFALSCCCASFDFALSIRPLISPESSSNAPEWLLLPIVSSLRARPFFHVGIEVTARRNNSAVIGKKEQGRALAVLFREIWSHGWCHPSGYGHDVGWISINPDLRRSRIESRAKPLKMSHATACKLVMQIRHLNLAT